MTMSPASFLCYIRIVTKFYTFHIFLISTSRKKSSFIFQYFLMSMSVCFTDVQALEIAHKYMVIKGNNFLAGIFWLAGSRPVE